MYYVTLKALREEGACYEGYNKVVRALQGKEFTEEDECRESYIRFKHDEQIPLSFILESNGLGDALWALRACEQTTELKRDERLFAVRCARKVQHLMKDRRSLDALDVAERFANGYATEEELSAAWAAAMDAAMDVAMAAVRAAAWAAARDAAMDAAWDAAMDAAWAAAWDEQKQIFIEMFCTTQEKQK